MRTQTALKPETAPAFTQASAARSLQLLQAIEPTIDRVEHNTRLLRMLVDELNDNLVKLKTEASQSALDPGGDACRKLEDAADYIAAWYANDRIKRLRASESFSLTGDEDVADAYGVFMVAVKDFHDTVEELREWIETHDALLEPGNGKVFDTADTLFVSLGIAPQ